MIRVLIVDDFVLIYQGLQTIFSSEIDIRVVGTAQNNKQAIQQIIQTKPDVVLLGVPIPSMVDIEAAQIFIEQFPQIKVIVWSAVENDPVIWGIISFANDFQKHEPFKQKIINPNNQNCLLKEIVTQNLTSVIRSTYSGKSYFTPLIINSLTEEYRSGQTASFYPYSSRQGGIIRASGDDTSLNVQDSQAQALPTCSGDMLGEPQRRRYAFKGRERLSKIESQKSTIGNIKSVSVSDIDDQNLAKINPKKSIEHSKLNSPFLDPKPAQVKTTKKRAKVQTEKPLFPYGDWLTIILGVFILSQKDGMGHHLGHAGLFFLMLALIARPISFLSNAPLKNRRAIGIFSFAAIFAHSIYASGYVLDWNLATISNMSTQARWGLWTGIISLLAITPAAVTSFQSFRQKLGKTWRKIHLLTVPALGLAILHTVLLGPHYLANYELQTINYLRSFGIILVGLLVLLMRRRVFWSILGLNKKSKSKAHKPEKKAIQTTS